MNTSHETSSNSLSPRSARAMLAVVRIMLGALFLGVWVDNLGKNLYTPEGYAGLTRLYQRSGDAPAIWKDLMGFLADHAEVFARLQLVGELTLGVLLVVGIATRPVGFAAAGYLAALWISEVGVPGEWIWSLVFPTLAALTVAVFSAGRSYGFDAVLLDRSPLRRLPRWAVG